MQLVSGLPPKEPAPASDVEFSQAKDRQQIAAVWGKLRAEIQRALQFTDGTEIEWQEKIINGELQLWVVQYRGDVVACVIVGAGEHFSGIRVVVYAIAGSRMRDWMPDLLKLLDELREKIGAKSVVASCRPGLARYLQRAGLKRRAVLMEMSDG